MTDVPPSDTTVWRAVVRVLRSPLHKPLHLLTDPLCCALFPDTCRLCGDPLLRFDRVPVCQNCSDLCAEKSACVGSLCRVCGEDLGIAEFTMGDPVAEKDRRCEACRLVPPPFRRAVACGTYETELRGFTHLLKYDRITPVADRLGEMLAAAIASLVHEAPAEMLVVPVPLFVGKQRERGYNQAALLAASAVETLRGSHPSWKLQLSIGALMRRRATESQAGLSSHKRRANLRGAFFVPQPRVVAGRDILLIDDIYTTGTTARECSKALLGAGAASVWVATLARAQREGVARFDTNSLDTDVSTLANATPVDKREPGAVATFF